MGRCFVNLCAKLHQLCLIVFYCMDSSPPGSSVHRILQASILEWVAISSSRESFQPRDRTRVLYISYPCLLYCQVGSLPLALFWTSMKLRLLWSVEIGGLESQDLPRARKVQFLCKLHLYPESDIMDFCPLKFLKGSI